MEDTEVTSVLDGDMTVEPGSETDPRALIERAAAATKEAGIEKSDQLDATEWFLQSASEPKEIHSTVILNVGTPTQRKEIRWTIRALDGAVIRRIRNDAERMVRRPGGEGQGANAGYQANLRIVTEGTVTPAVKELARDNQVADPAEVVELAFKRKPGLIDQIAGSILTLSGYDQDDLRDETEVNAAGNS